MKILSYILFIILFVFQLIKNSSVFAYNFSNAL